MKISIIGSGYVGLTSGICLAEIGHQVTCIDIDEKKIATLQKGEIPIYEPQLKDLLEKNYSQKNIQFSSSLSPFIQEAEIIFLALPTPENKDGLDISYIEKATQDIVEIISPEDGYKVLTCKSTVPIGTNEKIQKIIETKKDLKIGIASNPEFLREGSAIIDFMNPDRIVIGTKEEKANFLLKKVYEPLNASILSTDIITAEMIKLVANSFLATKISFINSIAILCEKTKANIELVSKGIGLDPRIGPHFLKAGIGYGGSCFPKDIRCLALSAREYGNPLSILEEAQKINQEQGEYFFEKIQNQLKSLKGKKIALWGLAFKQETDDIRESVAIILAKKILEQGGELIVWDPKAIKNTKLHGNLEGSITYATEMYECLNQADALVIATEWNQFINANFVKVKEKLKNPIIFDGRNLLSKKTLEKIGFKYYNIGTAY